MYKLMFALPVLICLLTGCGTMFDISGKGSLDKKIYYDVQTNQVINTYPTSINSIYFSRSKNDSTFKMDRIVLDEPTDTLLIPVLKDSIAFYDFHISVYLSGDHWRMQHHLDISEALVRKKRKIYSRFTSH